MNPKWFLNRRNLFIQHPWKRRQWSRCTRERVFKNFYLSINRHVRRFIPWDFLTPCSEEAESWFIASLSRRPRIFRHTRSESHSHFPFYFSITYLSRYVTTCPISVTHDREMRRVIVELAGKLSAASLKASPTFIKLISSSPSRRLSNCIIHIFEQKKRFKSGTRRRVTSLRERSNRSHALWRRNASRACNCKSERAVVLKGAPRKRGRTAVRVYLVVFFSSLFF